MENGELLKEFGHSSWILSKALRLRIRYFEFMLYPLDEKMFSIPK
jgi:hypothetical protein